MGRGRRRSGRGRAKSGRGRRKETVPARADQERNRRRQDAYRETLELAKAIIAGGRLPPPNSALLTRITDALATSRRRLLGIAGGNDLAATVSDWRRLEKARRLLIEAAATPATRPVGAPGSSDDLPKPEWVKEREAKRRRKRKRGSKSVWPTMQGGAPGLGKKR